jgi:Uma2 family endonuclease
MAIVLEPGSRPPVEVVERTYTAADLAALPSNLPSGPVHYELDNGRLISMSPPGDEHGAVEANFSYALMHYGQLRGHGKVRAGETGIVLWRDPDRVVGADVLFVANASLPIRRSPEGYLETIPDLVVEVTSKNDTRPHVQRKVNDYLQAGVKVVWVADPSAGTVTEYQAAVEPAVHGQEETLTLEDLIPGFQLSVREALAD